MKKLLIATAAAALLGSFASLANAVTTTAQFDVKLTVTKACNVSAGTAIDFGSVASTSTADIERNTTISVTCSRALPYTIGLKSQNNTGTGNATGVGSMKGATQGNNDTVGYQLRQNTGTGAVWGNTIGTNTVGVTGNGTAQTRTVYATVSGSALNVQADAYSDIVTVSVDY